MPSSDPSIHVNGNGDAARHPLSEYEPENEFQALVKSALGHLYGKVESEARRTRQSIDAVSVDLQVTTGASDEARRGIETLTNVVRCMQETLERLSRALLPDTSERPSVPETPVAKRDTDERPPPIEGDGA